MAERKTSSKGDILLSTTNDDELFREIQAQATILKQGFDAVVSDYQLYEDAYLLKLAPTISQELTRANIIPTVAPDARNVVLGAMRLMIGTDPIWKVSIPGDQEVEGDPEMIEKNLARWWEQSGRIARRPIHYDIILSALLYGTMVTGISSIPEMAKMAPSDYRPRIERRARIAPLLIESWNPKGCFFSFDQFGVNRFYREVTTTNGYIADTFEAGAEKFSQNRSTEAVLKLWYDLQNVCMWAGDTLLTIEKHKLTEIPVIVNYADGSGLFDKPEEKNQPLLYTLVKSGLYDQQMVGTAIVFAMAWALGKNPLFKHKAPSTDPSRKLDVNFDEIGGVVEMVEGEEFDPITNKNIIDPSVREAFQLAIEKGRESSIHPQAFGAPGSGNTFSEMALMNQAGRLPLIGPSRMAGSHIATIADTALLMIREGKGFNKEDGISLTAKQIPEIIDIKANLEIKLAQDRLQLANIASLLKQQGLADDEWIQNEIIGITNTKETRAKIWGQEASKQLYAVWLQNQVTQMQQATQQAMMAGQGGIAPGAGGPPGMDPNAGAIVPPDQLPAMQDQGQGVQPRPDMIAPGQAPMTAPGAPTLQGLPQQMSGLIPGQGAGLPPEVALG